jgi:hypothetical protein
MKYILTPVIKKYKLINKSIKKHKLSLNNQKKPKKYKLINPHFLNIILNSEQYDSSFDDPLKHEIKIDDLNYRMCLEQREKWVDYIVNNDPRILKVKGKKNCVILILKNITSENNVYGIRYLTFMDNKFRKLEKESGGADVIKEIKNEKKEKRLYNVQNKQRTKRRNKKKIRRK